MKVTVPVGAGAPAEPVTMAVSVKVWPTATAGGATWVTIVGTAWFTVVTSVPVPVPGSEVSWVPAAKPSWALWTPGLAGRASLVGALSTLNVKLIRHVSLAAPGGPSTTGALGVNCTLPWAASITAMANVVPAQPGRAPMPVALSWNTPGSTEATGQSPLARAPQAGTRVMAFSVTLPTLSLPLDRLGMSSDPGSPVWPTTTAVGQSGVAARPTPADAGLAMSTSDDAVTIAAAPRAPRERLRLARAPYPGTAAVVVGFKVRIEQSSRFGEWRC